MEVVNLVLTEATEAANEGFVKISNSESFENIYETNAEMPDFRIATCIDVIWSWRFAA